KQQKNITETGEQDLTEKLSGDYAVLKKNPGDVNQMRVIRTDVSNIMLLNMQAIQIKEKLAEQTASNAIFWISIAGTVCFIIALTLLFNLPGNIANPIRELTASIKQIADRNYSQRLHFKGTDEFSDLAASFNTMAEKLEEYQQSNIEKLMMEKKRIEALINNMKDPVIGLDQDGKVLFMNEIACRISGLQHDKVMGRLLQTIAVENDLIRSLAKDLFAESGARSTGKAPLKIYADGRESYFEEQIIPIRIVPTGETEEKAIGTVLVLQNITTYKELDFAKTNFIATISHELKTPISSIKMGLQLLENRQVGPLNEEQQNLLNSIGEDAGRLLKITGELLNMTQVETGSIQLSVQPASVKEIVDYALHANQSAAESRHIQLQVKTPDNDLRVLADKDKTAWVLNNLVSNAIRYSHEHDSVSIDVVQQNDEVHFSVRDTGYGIAPEYQERIFDRYFRVPGIKREGTGLGLSISKEFIEAQGGRITLRSELGAGSVFAFVLKSA
ncbi:MAG: HAMP domain-containing protein, partial [Bacteroidota bacterium]|nr:HAMP domain-containing protein [Bacteroidota bacterium]